MKHLIKTVGSGGGELTTEQSSSHIREIHESEIAQCLRCAIEWNDEYKHINNLAGGNPYWVDWAKKLLSESVPPAAQPAVMTAEQLLDEMVRDFCKVGPKPKSEVRSRIEAYAREALRRREAELVKLIPSTYFADRLLTFRIERLVDGWKRAIESNQHLEAQVWELKEALQRGEWIFGYPYKDENGEPSEQTFVADSEQLDKVEKNMKDVEGFFLRWEIKSLTRAEAELLLGVERK